MGHCGYCDDEIVDSFRQNEDELPFEVELKAQHAVLAKHKKYTLPGTVVLKTPNIVCQAPPLDLVCVLDRSDSMAGQKISLLRKALSFMVEQLTDKDRISLVHFDHESERLCPLLRATPDNKKVLAQQVARIQSRGGTNIRRGMQQALLILKSRRTTNPIASIFLMTDGQDQYCPTGFGPTDFRFTVNCFGFGAGHDGALMQKISAAHGGNYFFIEELDTIGTAFATCLGSLQSTLLTEIKLFVTERELSPRMLGREWRPHPNSDSQVTQIPQLQTGKERGFVFELSLPALKQVMTFTGLTARVQCKNSVGSRTYSKTCQLKLTVDEMESKADEEVMVYMMRHQSSQMVEQVMAMDQEHAYQALQNFSNDLRMNQSLVQKDKILSGVQRNLMEHRIDRNNLASMQHRLVFQQAAINQSQSKNKREEAMSKKAEIFFSR